VLLIAMVVHRNAVARRSANQQAETQPAVAAAPAIPSAPPVSQPPVDAVTTPAAETPSAVQSPAPTDAKDDSAHARKGRRIATKDDPPESAAEPAAEKPGGRCQLQGNEISAYLDIADKNRAGGNYDDALREYRAVTQCPGPERLGQNQAGTSHLRRG
jgi:hypothetical protein